MFFVRILFFSALVLFAPYVAAVSCNIGPVSSVCSKQNVEESLQPQYKSSFAFLDRYNNNWDSVKILAGHSIIQSSEYFNPNGYATRAEALKMVMESLYKSSPSRKKNTTTDKLGFDDVINTSDWFYHYVEDASLSGFISPYSQNNLSFRPNDTITRQEFIKIIYNAISSIKTLKASKAQKAFLDQSSIAQDILPMVTSLRTNKIINGYLDGYLRPNQNITRGDVAGIIVKAFFPTESDLRFSTGKGYQKCTLGEFICAGGGLGNGDGVNSGNGTVTTGAGFTVPTENVQNITIPVSNSFNELSSIENDIVSVIKLAEKVVIEYPKQIAQQFAMKGATLVYKNLKSGRSIRQALQTMKNAMGAKITTGSIIDIGIKKANRMVIFNIGGFILDMTSINEGRIKITAPDGANFIEKIPYDLLDTLNAWVGLSEAGG